MHPSLASATRARRDPAGLRALSVGLASPAAQIDEIVPVLHADKTPDIVHKEIGL